MRISVSDLESYRLFRTADFMTLEKLLSQLKREEKPSPKMLASSAFHAFLEKSQGNEVLSEIEIDGHKFRFDLDAEIQIPIIREMKATKEYEIDGTTVTLVGKVDAMNGVAVDDHKLTAQFDGEKYGPSVQWKAYLSIFNAEMFNYNVFEGEQDKQGVWVIDGFHKLTLYRYPNLEADVTNLLRGFVSFLRVYFPERLAA